MRKIASLTALLTFILLFPSSVVLYTSPHGRIAYWADWRFLGLTKTEWVNQHVTIGILFLFAIFLHAYCNWKPIVAYLKNKTRQVRIFTREFNIALILVVVCIIGTYAEIAPFRWVSTFGDYIKTEAARDYGEPPYGRAELSSLKNFSAKMGLDLAKSLMLLRNAGIQVENEQQVLLDIAKKNNTSPQQLYMLMKLEGEPSGGNVFPAEQGKGFGKRRLSEVCRQYGLDTTEVLEVLASEDIAATPDLTIKQIAEQNGMAPREVFTAIRNAAMER